MPALSAARFSLHGLPVSVTSDDPDLRAFVRAHFDTQEGADPDADLDVHVCWRWGRTEAGERPASVSSVAGTEKAGRGLVLSRDDGADAAQHAVWSRVPGFPELTL